MDIYPDFKDLLVSFNEHEVDYVIVGAYALAFHGVPRFTGDMDILVRSDAGNARRIIAALADFGFGTLDISAEDFQAPERVLQLGVAPVRVDIITSLSGVSWKEASRGKVKGEYGGVEAYFIGREQYVANKKAVGRKKDLADLEALGED